MARYNLAAVAGKHSVAENTRLMSAFDLVGTSHYERAKSAAASEANGTKIKRDVTRRHGLWTDFQIPIYDLGNGAASSVPEAYVKAANRLAERAVNVRSEAREAYVVYRGKYDLARHYQNRVLPLQKRIQDEALLQYSGMLVDLSQLIIDARTRILSNVDAINARRDFWIAATDLKAALVGGLAGGGEAGGEATAAAGGGGAAAAGH